MSRHDGVSCDVCMKNNFSGRRYKCLVCYDFDLCADCHEAGLVGNQHTAQHSVQCILTRSDYELFYGNEQTSLDHAQSLACPFCRNLGFTDSSLHEHVAAEHADARVQVICPACAAAPHGDPNRMTDDLASHLAVEHVSRRDTTVEESRAARRLPHPSARTSAGLIARGSRGRGHGNQTGHLAFARESAAASDPITELLNQLGGMRRANSSSNYSSTLQQIQQLQQQLGSGRGGPRRAIVATVPGGRDRAGLSGGEGPYGELWWDELAAATGGRPAAIILGESGQTAAVTGSTAAAIKEELRSRAAGAGSGSFVTMAPSASVPRASIDGSSQYLLRNATVAGGNQQENHPMPNHNANSQIGATHRPLQPVNMNQQPLAPVISMPPRAAGSQVIVSTGGNAGSRGRGRGTHIRSENTPTV